MPPPPKLPSPPPAAITTHNSEDSSSSIWNINLSPHDCPTPCHSITRLQSSNSTLIAPVPMEQLDPHQLSFTTSSITPLKFQTPKIYFGENPQNHARAAILNSLSQQQLTIPPVGIESGANFHKAVAADPAPLVPGVVPTSAQRSRVADHSFVRTPVTSNLNPSTSQASSNNGHEIERQGRDFITPPTSPKRLQTPDIILKNKGLAHQSINQQADRDLQQREEVDVEVFNASGPSYLLMSFNGTCNDIESSQEATNGFVIAFERSMAHQLQIPLDQVHVWEITCGSLIVNFSIIWSDQSGTFEQLQRRTAEQGFVFFWQTKYYAATEVRREFVLVSEGPDQTLSNLVVGPATGHVYQGFIYIIIGAVVGLILLVIATIFIVRLHRRKGRGFSVSGDSTPTKFSDANDYTLTRLPRTTKLYLDDVERNPWAYTNPDFHGSLTSVAPGKKMEYLNFINTGMIPMRDRSPTTSFNSSLVTLTKPKESFSGGKLTGAMANPVPKPLGLSFGDLESASTKQKMFVDFHNQSMLSSSSKTGSTNLGSTSDGGVSALPSPAPRVHMPALGLDSSHI
jgi:hypothetical protein